MPQIPEFRESADQVPMRPDEVNVSPNSFGADLAALSTVGGEIGDFGSRLMSARKRAAENDAVSTAHSDDIKWLADTSQQLKLNYTKKNDDGSPMIDKNGQAIYDADGFANAFAQKMADRRNAQVAAMPTGDAQRQYMDATNRNYGLAYHEAVTWEGVTKAMTYKRNFQARTNNNANYLVDQQDPYSAIQFTQDNVDADRRSINGAIGTSFTPEEAQQATKDAERTYVHALFVGLGNNPASARVGLNLLNSMTGGEAKDYQSGQKIPGTKLDAGLVQQSLTADEIRIIRDRLQGVADQGLRDHVTELRSWLSDQNAIFSSSDPKDLQRFNSGEAVENLREFKKLKDDGVIGEPEFQKAVVELTMGKAYSIVRRDMAMLPDAKKEQFDARIDQEYKGMLMAFGYKDGTALAEKNHYKEVNERAWSNFQRERAYDPASYVEVYGKNPAGKVSQDGVPDQARTRWRMNQQNSIGYQGTIFTRDEQSNLVGKFKQDAENNPQAAAQRLDQMKQSQGPFAGQAMQELIQKGKLPSYFQQAYEMDRPEVAESIIKHNQPEMRKALMESINAKDKKQLETNVESAMGPAVKAFTVAGGLKPAQQIKENVMLEAMDQHANGKSLSDAAKAATDKLVNSQYHILGTAFMPKQIGKVLTNPDYVKGEMQAIYNPDVQTRLGIQAPASADGKADRASSIAMGRWVTNGDNLGMTFMVPYGQSWTAVRDKTGKPVSIDFAKASINPSKDSLDYNKPWWNGLGDDMQQADPMSRFKTGSKPSASVAGAVRALSGEQVAQAAGTGSVKFDAVNEADRKAAAEQLKMSQAQLDVVKNPDLVKGQRTYTVVEEDPATKAKKFVKYTDTTLKDGRVIKMKGDPEGKQ